MERLVECEWLDVLPASDPGARRSREDLRRINACMGNAAILARVLTRHFAGAAPTRVAEIGAGDAHFLTRLARRLAPAWHQVDATVVDRQAVVAPRALAELASLQWRVRTRVADVLEWFENDADGMFDIVLANLFLHHFEERALRRLLRLARNRTRVFAACEPRRSRVALAASRLLGLIGCNRVSRHDAVTSVRAGFAGCELSALWGCHGEWSLHEAPAGLFSHVFVASRHCSASPVA